MKNKESREITGFKPILENITLDSYLAYSTNGILNKIKLNFKLLMILETSIINLYLM